MTVTHLFKETHYRILVAGGRGWTDVHTVAEKLIWARDNPVDGITAEPRKIIVVHGHCLKGADAIADHWAHTWGWIVERHPVLPEEWVLRGKAAGPDRNSRMVALGANVCLAFPFGPSKGTRDTIAKAQAAGIPTFVFEGVL